MNDLPVNSASLTVQLFKITTNKDGGGRIQLDFGADALDEIQKVQKANGQGGMNFQMGLIPLKASFIGGSSDFVPDPETGEITL